MGSRVGLLVSVSMATLCVAASGVRTATAQAFEGIGFLGTGQESTATGISADGSTVVGYSANGSVNEAFRWDGGLMGLGGASIGSYANAVSADGKVVVGYISVPSSTEAFRWVEGVGMMNIGTLGGSAQAQAVNADGTVIAGTSNNGFNGEAFRWVDDGSPNGSMVGLGYLGPADLTYSFGFGVNADGSVIVGVSSIGSTSEAFRWIDGLGMHGLESLGGSSAANAVNAAGDVVVGSSHNGVFSEAFRWVDDGSVTGAMTGLGFVATGTSMFSAAYAVSGDGSTVVGMSLTDGASQAFRWIDGDPAGMTSIAHLLASNGVNLGGWTLERANGISADGNIVVGNGRNPDGLSEAWIARLGLMPGLITPDDAMNSLLTLGQVPNVASGLVYNFLDTTSEYARQHAAAANVPDVQPLGYGEDGASAVPATPARPLRVFGYGLGGASFDYDGWSGAALVGASVELRDQLVVGGSMGYGAVNSDMGMGGEATLRGPAATVFMASTPETGFQFLAAGTIAGFDADIRRGYMNGSGQASSSGETDGTGYGGLVRAGYAFAVDDRNRLEPYASYQAAHVGLDAYTEAGGPFPAEISEMSQTDQVGRLGAEMRHSFQPNA